MARFKRKKRQMKKLLIILAFATAYALLSCKGEDEKPRETLLTRLGTCGILRKLWRSTQEAEGAPLLRE